MENSSKQVAATRKELDTLVMNLNANPLSCRSQQEVRNKQNELVGNLRIEEADD